MENYIYQYFSEDSSTDREIGTVIITNKDEDETVIAEYTYCVNHITYNYRNPNYSNRHSLNFNDKKHFLKEFASYMRDKVSCNLYFCDENNLLMEMNYQADINFLKINKLTMAIYLKVNDSVINTLLEI